MSFHQVSTTLSDGVREIPVDIDIEYDLRDHMAWLRSVTVYVGGQDITALLCTEAQAEAECRAAQTVEIAHRCKVEEGVLI